MVLVGYLELLRVAAALAVLGAVPVPAGGEEEVLLVAVLHDGAHVAHGAHVAVVERHAVAQRQRGEVRVLLQEDEVPAEAELHGLGEEAAGEALADAGQVARGRDEVPDLACLLTHHRDRVVGILK